MTPSSRYLTGILISVAGALCFSTKAVFVKLAYMDSAPEPLTLLAVRMLFSLPFFAVSAAVGLWRNPAPRSGKQWVAIAATGLLGYHISSLLDFAGLQYISAGLERLILFTYPTLVLLLSALLFRERVTARQWMAVGLSYAGIVLAFRGEYGEGPAGEHLVRGAVLVFLCAITYGSYLMASARIIRTTSPSVFNSFAMLAACTGVLLQHGIAGTGSLSELPVTTWWYGFLMAVISTVIPSYLVSESIRRIGGGNTAIIASLGPVSTIFMAWWLLDERVTLLQLAGTVAILCGVWLVASTGKAVEPNAGPND